MASRVRLSRSTLSSGVVHGSVPSSTQLWAWCSFLPPLQRAPQRMQQEPTSLAGTLILRSSLTTRSYFRHRSSTSWRVGSPSGTRPTRNRSTRLFMVLMTTPPRCRRAETLRRTARVPRALSGGPSGRFFHHEYASRRLRLLRTERRRLDQIVVPDVAKRSAP